MDPVSIGRERYRDKVYAGALEAFTQAVKVSSGHILLNALDHRAATYEKLDQLQSALRDARQMIDLMPEVAKGYLRCAKVLQLRGDDALALKIYERGLKKVKIGTDNDRPVLQKLFAKLQRKQEPKKNLDPFLMLPTELAHMVCQYLEIRDLVVCLAVSKLWKRFLETLHELWTTIDLGSIRRSVSQNSLRAFLRRSNYSLSRAVLRIQSADINESKLNYLTKTCRQLNYLELRQGRIGKSLIEALPRATNLRCLILSNRCVVTLAAIPEILEACPQLSIAEFHEIDASSRSHMLRWKKMESLQTLVLATEINESSELLDLKLAELVSSTPRMESISILGWQMRQMILQPRYSFAEWTCLKEVNLDGSHFEYFPVLPSDLQRLSLSHMYQIRLMESQHYSWTDLPQLKYFNSFQSPSLAWPIVLQLILPSLKANNLNRLYMTDTTSPIDPESLPVAPSVTELSLERLPASEGIIMAILRKFPNLRQLDLSDTKVTGVAIKELMARKEPRLERLRLWGCLEISPDAIEYARKQGTVVDYKASGFRHHHGRRAWRFREFYA